MKLLFTEGVGASQTTTNAQDEKIPVYETKAAAETDLANLEVGQIIATKDEGNENAKPVDVVEKGNMHAVTSNAVAVITSSKVGFTSASSTDIIEAFSGVGIPNELYAKTIKMFCDDIANYNSGIHSLSIGGPAYGFILWKHDNEHFVIEVLSYSDYANNIIRVCKVGGAYTVYRFVK